MKKILLAAAITALMSHSAIALTNQDNLLKKLQVKFPANHIDKVLETPIPGIYEIDSGREVAYTTKDGRFIFLGLIDAKEGKDLTAIRKAELSKVDFGELPLANAIRDIRGNGKRTLAIFSDPDCPYCQKLESEMIGLTDITIYTFQMPIAQLHPGAKRKAISIWCADDQVNAWGDAVGKGANVVDRECQNPIDENLALAAKLSINGTPTLIAPDGRVSSGVMTAKQIEDWLAK